MHWLLPFSEGTKSTGCICEERCDHRRAQRSGSEAVAEETVDALNKAADSLKNEGTLTMGLDCLVSLPPDLIASVSVKSMLKFGSPSSSNKPNHFTTSIRETTTMHNMAFHHHFLAFPSVLSFPPTQRYICLEVVDRGVPHHHLSLGLGS